MLSKLNITHPKQKSSKRKGFESFYPYYAGYPQSFAENLLASADLDTQSLVLDPWNGSGTTTKASSRLGIDSIGYDINPAMIVISAARLLPKSELSCLSPIASEILQKANRITCIADNDVLSNWFCPITTKLVRSIERAIASILIPKGHTIFSSEVEISRLVASLYLALFATAREISKPFRSSNPTWIRKAKTDIEKISISKKYLRAEFLKQVQLLEIAYSQEPECQGPATTLLKVVDSTLGNNGTGVDFILSSPPYCTRIDYAVATSIELAVLSGALETDVPSLSKKMLGTPKVINNYQGHEDLGALCANFLDRVKGHASIASSTYYYKTHLDYYRKMSSSLKNVAMSLKESGIAVLVVQDSQYKDIHNDVPSIIADMAKSHGLKLGRREDFTVNKNMISINPKARLNESRKAIESVLCFTKTSG